MDVDVDHNVLNRFRSAVIHSPSCRVSMRRWEGAVLRQEVQQSSHSEQESEGRQCQAYVRAPHPRVVTVKKTNMPRQQLFIEESYRSQRPRKSPASASLPASSSS